MVLNSLKMYRGIKITTIIVLIIAVAVQLVLIMASIPAAIDYRELSGGGRAQAEFFTMPLVVIGGGLSLLCAVLLLINGFLDIFRIFRKEELYRRNLLVYLGLILGILLPALATKLLIGLMYSGWD
jgi:hypothetical protein